MPMKRIILAAMAVAFAVAVQAGDGKCCQGKDTASAGCCSHKMQTSEQAKGTCPFAKAACTKQTAAKQAPVKQTALLSPKAADLAR